MSLAEELWALRLRREQLDTLKRLGEVGAPIGARPHPLPAAPLPAEAARPK
jgi:hypothetical protein